MLKGLYFRPQIKKNYKIEVFQFNLSKVVIFKQAL